MVFHPDDMSKLHEAQRSVSLRSGTPFGSNTILFLMKEKQQYLVIKAVCTDLDGVSHPDYQMIENGDKIPIEQVKKGILDYALNRHPEYLWSVDVYDADNLPPGAIPDGTTFTLSGDEDWS